jgi:hypothetical protein
VDPNPKELLTSILIGFILSSRVIYNLEYFQEASMKRVSFLLLAALLVLTLSMPGSALAQDVPPTWNSTIYYYNPGSSAGNLGITFTPPTVPSMDLSNQPVAAHGFSSLSIGSTVGYQGSAMISADVPLVAVYKQFDVSGGTYAPVLYSSFDASQSGTTGKFYLPSVLNSGYYVSKVGIQNVESVPVTLTLHFYDSTGAEKVTLTHKILDNQPSWMFQILDDATDVPGIGSSFDGSLVIDAVKTGGTTPARIVAAVEDLQSQGQRSYAYEGSGVPATDFYLPYANCRYSTNQQSTIFYVQNTDAVNDATISVYYYTTTGTGITYYSPTAQIKPGARMAVSACDTKVYAKMNGKNGTARITSKQKLVVIGKATSTDGLSTAFTGQSAGGTRILLPYIPYSKLISGERATLSIMNIGSATATKATINFYYKISDTSYAAQKVTIPSLPKYGKYTTIPKVSGAAINSDGNYLGAAEVISDQPVVVVVRVAQTVTGIPGIIALGEDYTGIPCSGGCQ